jgi:hypothetical protein
VVASVLVVQLHTIEKVTEIVVDMAKSLDKNVVQSI